MSPLAITGNRERSVLDRGDRLPVGLALERLVAGSAVQGQHLGPCLLQQKAPSHRVERHCRTSPGVSSP